MSDRITGCGPGIQGATTKAPQQGPALTVQGRRRSQSRRQAAAGQVAEAGCSCTPPWSPAGTTGPTRRCAARRAAHGSSAARWRGAAQRRGRRRGAPGRGPHTLAPSAASGGPRRGAAQRGMGQGWLQARARNVGCGLVAAPRCRSCPRHGHAAKTWNGPCSPSLHLYGRNGHPSGKMQPGARSGAGATPPHLQQAQAEAQADVQRQHQRTQEEQQLDLGVGPGQA
jgi:hypothetical protein